MYTTFALGVAVPAVWLRWPGWTLQFPFKLHNGCVLFHAAGTEQAPRKGLYAHQCRRFLLLAIVLLFWMARGGLPTDWPGLANLAVQIQSVTRQKFAEVQQRRQPFYPSHTGHQIANFTVDLS